MKDFYTSEINRLKGELEREKEHESNLKCAKAIHDLYSCYIKVGFTKEQAWEILMAQIKKVNN